MNCEWVYEYLAPPANGSKKYNISLTGKYINNKGEIVWTTAVFESGSPNEFVWDEGVVSVDHTAGRFTIIKDPQDLKTSMMISFTKDQASDNVTISLSNILNNVP